MENILEFQEITKTFPGTVALDGVSFSVKKGLIHGLVGENGAGKSTLVKILAGAYTPDSGTITYQGQSYNKLNPALADGLGIRIVYQELNQVPELTVSDNIFLGQEKFFLDDKSARNETRKILSEMGIEHVRPGERIKNLSIGIRQLVEITKATCKKPDLIIMDEPTSSLAQTETDLLLAYIQKLKAHGCTIIYISHKLEEVLEISDTVSVLRDGKHIHTGPASSLDKAKIITMMVNRDMKDLFPPHISATGEVVFKALNIKKPGLVDDVSFELKKGEIVGFSGLMGCGRTELAETIFGVHGKFSGDLYINGKKKNIRFPWDAASAGIGFVTEDRKKTGVIDLMSVGYNLTLSDLVETLNMKLFTDKKKEYALYEEYKGKLNIKTPSFTKKISELSGGNQQKVIISKWILKNLQILIMDEPTRGIDVGAKFEIYKIMNQLSAEGLTIMFISSEIEEIVAMCDRAYVMQDHKIVTMLERENLNTEKLLSAFFVRRGNQ